MPRILLVLFFVMILGVNAWAMGSAGEEPDPAEFNQDISAEVSDVSGVAVKLSQVRVEGRSAFSGAMGQGQVVLPFAKIDYVEFSAKGEVLSASVLLRDGQRIVMKPKSSSQLVGQANFGKYRINLGQILRVRFLP